MAPYEYKQEVIIKTHIMHPDPKKKLGKTMCGFKVGNKKIVDRNPSCSRCISVSIKYVMQKAHNDIVRKLNIPYWLTKHQDQLKIRCKSGDIYFPQAFVAQHSAIAKSKPYVEKDISMAQMIFDEEFERLMTFKQIAYIYLLKNIPYDSNYVSRYAVFIPSKEFKANIWRDEFKDKGQVIRVNKDKFRRYI